MRCKGLLAQDNFYIMSNTVVGACYRRAELTNLPARYISCDFSGANLIGAELPGEFISCTFDDANMSISLLSRGTFRDCTFKNTKLHKAVLEGATFKRCALNTVDLFDTVGYTKANFKECSYMYSVKSDKDVSTEAMPDFRQEDTQPLPSSYYPSHKFTNKYKINTYSPYTSKPIAVDAIAMPEVDYYLSPQRQIEPYMNDIPDKMRKHIRGEQAWLSTLDWKHAWGYKDTAVLACSDIDVLFIEEQSEETQNDL